jgi:hypothetical protein
LKPVQEPEGLTEWDDSKETLGFSDDRRDVLGGAVGKTLGLAVPEILVIEKNGELGLLSESDEVGALCHGRAALNVWVRCGDEPSPHAAWPVGDAPSRRYSATKR